MTRRPRRILVLCQLIFLTLPQIFVHQKCQYLETFSVTRFNNPGSMLSELGALQQIPDLKYQPCTSESSFASRCLYPQSTVHTLTRRLLPRSGCARAGAQCALFSYCLSKAFSFEPPKKVTLCMAFLIRDCRRLVTFW